MGASRQAAVLTATPSLQDQGDSQVAHIVSVTGSQAVAVLEPRLIGAIGEEIRTQIGSVAKIRTPECDVIGLVSGMTVPVPSLTTPSDELRVIELDLVGEILRASPGARVFRRGVSRLPSLGDPIFLADREDLECIYSPQGRAFAQVGSLYQDDAIPAEVLVDDLLSKHFAIVGSTGAGKSCALAGILRAVLEHNPNGHVVLLDLHNEYAAAFEGCGELIGPSSLELPFWMLTNEELAAVVLGETPSDEEIEVFTEAAQYAKRRYTDASRLRAQMAVRKAVEASMSLDAPTPFRLNDMVSFLDEQMGRLDRTHSTLPYRRLKSRIDALMADPRYSFMFGSLTVQDQMAEILGRIFRIPVAGKPVTVLDLSAVPSEVLNVVISTLCRITFDIGVWSRGQIPITLVCEEAHRYAPIATKSSFAPTRRALARIAKEGRKYAISLGLITQRPSELDPTVLSQCNTVFAMRLANELDQQVIRAATADCALSLLNFLPSLGDGEAIAVGQGVALPMRIRFAQLPEERRPAGQGAKFSTAWREEAIDSALLDQVVTRWRMNARADG